MKNLIRVCHLQLNTFFLPMRPNMRTPKSHTSKTSETTNAQRHLSHNNTCWRTRTQTREINPTPRTQTINVTTTTPTDFDISTRNLITRGRRTADEARCILYVVWVTTIPIEPNSWSCWQITPAAPRMDTRPPCHCRNCRCLCPI